MTDTASVGVGWPLQENDCEVCEGTGVYPVIDRYGKHLYDIECPECIGDGKRPAIEEARER